MYQIVQVAYHVRDIYQSAEKMYQQFGAGPFFVSENIQLQSAQHRGESSLFVHSSAYGQWGNVMVELVRQEDDNNFTPFRDMYQASEEGLHHTAVFVDDFDASISDFETKGLPLATRCKTLAGGVEFGFIDATASMGHMIEIYEGSPPLKGFYQMVREASEDWDGSDLFR